MIVAGPVMDTVTERFMDIKSLHSLRNILAQFELPEPWIQELWKCITHTIVPAIKNRHDERQKEQVLSAIMKEFGSLSAEELNKLVTHVPVLDVGRITADRWTVEKLRNELRWHRAWDLKLKKPQKKNDLMDLLKDTITRFVSSSISVDDVSATFIRVLDKLEK
jgi:hypothetical protein